MATFYKCPNIGNCGKADSGETLTVLAGAAANCPECHSNLVAQTGNERSWKGLVLGAALLAFLAGIVWAALSFLSSEPERASGPENPGDATELPCTPKLFAPSTGRLYGVF